MFFCVERVRKRKMKVCGGSKFSPYTRETLLRVEAAGAEVIEALTPSDFLEGLQVFLENL